MKTVEIVYRYEAEGVLARPRPVDSSAARDRLDEGNRSFSALIESLSGDSGTARRVIQIDPDDLGLAADHSAPKQRPFAAVVGCSDARVPVELIFNEGPNDLFVIRVAGNGLGGEVLGSLKYAVEHLRGSLKAVVVLGHSGCGAVTAAVDAFLEPARYLPLATNHSLRTIIDQLLVVVQASASRMAEMLGPEIRRNPGYRSALIEMSALINAALAAYTVQQELVGGEPNEIRALYGVYLLETHQVWAPPQNRTDWNGLADPPRDIADFVELGNAVIRSERIASLLSVA